MTEHVRGLWVVAYREVLAFVSDRTRIAASLTFPILFLVIFGDGFGGIVGRMAGGVDLMTFMYPGVVARRCRSRRCSPAPRSCRTARAASCGGGGPGRPAQPDRDRARQGDGAAAVAMAQVLMLLVLAPVVGFPLDVGTVLRLVPVVLALSCVLAGIGILIASFAATQQGFELFMQALVFPTVLLGRRLLPRRHGARLDASPVQGQPGRVRRGRDRHGFLGSGPAAAGPGVSVLGHTMTGSRWSRSSGSWAPAS